MRQMRDFYQNTAGVQGLTFKKMLGSGGGNGFSIWPNLNQYVLLACWESEHAFQSFEASNTFQAFVARAGTLTTLFLHCAKSHGLWDKRQPFQVTETAKAVNKPAAVITRATIATKKLLHFWQYVPSVSKAIEGAPGLIFAAGVGEYPVFQQATFSIWQNLDSMRAYAYQGPLHSKVIQHTRKFGWYNEELFARFFVYKEHTHKGRSLLY